VQAAAAELELGELEFAGHDRQLVTAVAPVVVEYVPAAQFAHPLLDAYDPAVHGKHI
jgi:hypothetical protein